MIAAIAWGKENGTAEKEACEKSPFSNVHIYSTDILPAKSGLAANGCTNVADGDQRPFLHQCWDPI